MKRQFLTCWEMPSEYGCGTRRKPIKKKFYKKNKFDKNRGEQYKRKFYKHKYKKPRSYFSEKQVIVLKRKEIVNVGLVER